MVCASLHEQLNRLSLVLVPISKLQHGPLPSKCCKLESVLQLLLLSLSSPLDSLSPSRSLGVRHCMIGWRVTYSNWSYAKNGCSPRLQFQWNPSKVPSSKSKGVIFSTPLSHSGFNQNKASIGMGISSLVVISMKFGKPSAHFQYLCANNQHFEARFWNSNYRKGNYLQHKGWNLLLAKWITPSIGSSSTWCLDDLSIRIC